MSRREENMWLYSFFGRPKGKMKIREGKVALLRQRVTSSPLYIPQAPARLLQKPKSLTVTLNISPQNRHSIFCLPARLKETRPTRETSRIDRHCSKNVTNSSTKRILPIDIHFLLQVPVGQECVVSRLKTLSIMLANVINFDDGNVSHTNA